MNHGLTVKTQNANGTMTSRPVPENTFYLGHVSSDPGSVVAVNELGGLVNKILLRLHWRGVGWAGFGFQGEVAYISHIKAAPYHC